MWVRDMDHKRRKYKEYRRPLKCGHGEEWRKSVEQNISQVKKCWKGLKKKEQ